MKRIGKLICIIATALCLFACGKNTDTTAKKVITTTEKTTTQKAVEMCTVSFESDGSVLFSELVEKGEKAFEPENPTKAGHKFLGWYVGEEKWSFIGYVITEDITLTAKWEKKLCKVSVYCNVKNVNVTGLTKEKYEYGDTITLIASNIPSDKTIVWKNSYDIVGEGNQYTFTVGDFDYINIYVNSYRIFTKVTLGTYPKTLEDDSQIIADLNTLAGTLPTSENSHNWIDYGECYDKGVLDSYMWYIDIDSDNDGYNDYRGVYFVKYKPFYCHNEATAFYSHQDDNGYSINNVYWFKYEPIEWDILEQKDGKTLLLSDLIIDGNVFNPVGGSEEFLHNGKIGYANNYELSFIRKWLNEDFYNTAFNDAEKAKIQTTSVDNSLKSTTDKNNTYICDDTSDKVFILSRDEAKYDNNPKYFDCATERYTVATDYAKAQGLNQGTFYRYSWHLRSPSNSIPSSNWRTEHGTNVDQADGIRPAIWVIL